MYTLYCLDGSRATAAHMVLAESGLPHETKPVDITTDGHRTPEYLAVNPRGTIPALVDDKGVLVCETIAIMLFLADKHGLEDLAPMVTDPQRGLLLDWLVYHAVEVQEPVKRYFYAHRHGDTPEEMKSVRTHAKALFIERWKLVEEHLQAAGPFHLGERFSLADIYLLVAGSFSRKLADGDFPAIEECMRLTAARPRIAPVWEDHMAGLKRIVKTGVPK